MLKPVTAYVIILLNISILSARTWTNKEGLTVEADFKDTDGEYVEIVTTQGQDIIYKYKVSDLSAADQEFVRIKYAEIQKQKALAQKDPNAIYLISDDRELSITKLDDPHLAYYTKPHYFTMSIKTPDWVQERSVKQGAPYTNICNTVTIHLSNQSKYTVEELFAKKRNLYVKEDDEIIREEHFSHSQMLIFFISYKTKDGKALSTRVIYYQEIEGHTLGIDIQSSQYQLPVSSSLKEEWSAMIASTLDSLSFDGKKLDLTDILLTDLEESQLTRGHL